MIVSLDDMKQWLRVEHNEEDELIEGLIQQAQAAAEDFCRVSFETGTAQASVRAAAEDFYSVAAAEEPPEAVVLAVKLMVSHYYENRDNPDKQVYLAMRLAFENLLYPHRDPEKMF